MPAGCAMKERIYIGKGKGTALVKIRMREHQSRRRTASLRPAIQNPTP